jgi:hypothetical protein
MQRALVIVGMVALAACSGKVSTAPGGVDVSGNWSGPMSDALLGNGTLSFSLVQAANDSLSGTWATTFPDSSRDLGGNVYGAVNGSTVSIVLKPAGAPTCQYGPFRFTAAVSGSTSMSGTFAPAYACVVIDSGTFSVSRR